MTEDRTWAVLQDIVRTQSRSFLQYVREAFPWTAQADEQALQSLQRISEEDLAALQKITAVLLRRRVPLPYLGSFPSDFTCSNFVSLEHVLPTVYREQEAAIKDLEKDLLRLPQGEYHGAVHAFLQTKQNHLASLKQLASSLSKAPAA